MKFTSNSICNLLILIICGVLRYCESITFSEKYSPYRKKEGENRYGSDAPRPGWKDPYDMTGRDEHSTSGAELMTQADVEMDRLKQRLEESHTLLRRFVNVFLKHGIGVKAGEPTEFATRYFKLELLISGDEMRILQNYGQSRENVQISDASRVLQKIFSQNLHKNDHSSNMIGKMLQWLKKMSAKVLQSPEVTVVTSTLLMLLATVWMVYQTHSFRLGFFSLFITVFFASFGITWMRMYEEEEVKRFVNNQMYGQAPRHCTDQYMPWYEHMYYRMFGIDCYTFYKIRDVRSAIKVSPSDVLAHTFTSMLINPAKNIGIAYGQFVTNLMVEVPWYLKPVAMPLSFIIPLVFVTVSLALLCNYRLSLGITGFHMIPTWCGQQSREDRYVEDLSNRPRTSVSHSTSHKIEDSSHETKPKAVEFKTKPEYKQTSSCKCKEKKSSETTTKSLDAAKSIASNNDDDCNSEDGLTSSGDEEHEIHERQSTLPAATNSRPNSSTNTSIGSEDTQSNKFASGDHNSSTDTAVNKGS